MSILLFALLAVLASSETSFAQWSADAINASHYFEEPFPNPYVASIVTSCHSPDLNPSDIQGIEKVSFVAPGFTSGGLRSYLSFRRDSSGHLLRAPLMVILPGIFTSRNDGTALAALQTFSDRGFHVLLFPNPWSKSYLVDGPIAAPGDVTEEAKIVLTITRNYQAKLGSALGTTNLIGWSYGAFLAGVTAALDVEESQTAGLMPEFDGDVTLLNPPFDIFHSMLRLDDLMDRFAGIQNLSLFGLLGVGLQYCDAKVEGEIQDRFIQLAPGVVGASFRDDLVESMMIYNSKHHVEKIPNEAVAFTEWRAGFRFRKVMAEYEPATFAKYTPALRQLNTWVKRAARAGNNRIRVLTTEDDFINTQDQIGNLNSKLIVLPHGGHLGYRGLRGFRNFIDIVFGQPTIPSNRPTVPSVLGRGDPGNIW